MPSGADNVSFTFSPEEESEPVVTVVNAVAWTKSVEPLNLEPLHSIVDVEALNQLVTGDAAQASGITKTSEAVGLPVTFRYEGCEVTVEEDRVRVESE